MANGCWRRYTIKSRRHLLTFLRKVFRPSGGRITCHSEVTRSISQQDALFRITVANRDYHYLSQSEIASDNEDSRSRDTIANEHGLAATCNGSFEAAR